MNAPTSPPMMNMMIMRVVREMPFLLCERPEGGIKGSLSEPSVLP